MGLNVIEWRGVLNAVASKWGLQLRWVSDDGGLLIENDRLPSQTDDRNWEGIMKQALKHKASFIFEPTNRTSWMVEPIPMNNRLTFLIAGPLSADPIEKEQDILIEIQQFTKLLNTFYSQRHANLESSKEQMVFQITGFINDSFRSMSEESKRHLTNRLFFLHAFLIQSNWRENTIFPMLLSLLFKHLPSEIRQIYLPGSVYSIVESYQYWYNWCMQKSHVQHVIHLRSMNGTPERMYQQEGQLLSAIQIWFDHLQNMKNRMTKSDWQANLISWFGPLEKWSEQFLNFSYSWNLSKYLNDEIWANEEKIDMVNKDVIPQVSFVGKNLESVIHSLVQLSKREKEVLMHIICGKSNKDISTELGISEHTVKHHVTNILNKLGVVDRFHAFVWLYQQSNL